MKMLLKRLVFKVNSHVALALTVFKILTFQIVYLEKVGQGHWVWLLQWSYLLANIQIFKSRSVQFCAGSHRFVYIDISRFWSSKSRSRSRSTIFAMTQFDWNVKICKCVTHILVSSLTVWDIKFVYLPSKSRSV